GGEAVLRVWPWKFTLISYVGWSNERFVSWAGHSECCDCCSARETTYRLLRGPHFVQLSSCLGRSTEARRAQVAFLYIGRRGTARADWVCLDSSHWRRHY